jgi:hypothetical protein
MMKMTRVDTTRTGKAKVVQAAYQNAMRQQGKVKPEDFPINNRAARRRLAKGKKPGET